jgi:hypothetical protein
VAVYQFAGELVKRGKNKSWNNRWFVLADSNLSYYKDRKEWEAAIGKFKVEQNED